MYKIILSFLYTTAHCANYQRYGESTGQYSTYTTIANLYNQSPYKTQTYNNDISSFPKEATRYPNYNPLGSTSSYNTGYNQNLQNYNTNEQRGLYNQPGYGNSYGSSYGSTYGSTYGGAYGYTTPRYGEGYSSYEMPFMRNIGEYCINRSPQMGIWVDSLMGMWYGVELVQHLAGDSMVDYSRTCIVIHIAEPSEQPSSENPTHHVQHITAKFRHEYRHLRLLWDEAGQTIEYALYFRNDSAGYWQVSGSQNGTITTRGNYQQFSGSIQVLKAVNDHLVLSFCQEPANGRPAQLYSVLFSREPGNMAQWEIESVHNMLQNKKLSTASRRMVCGNSGARPVTSIVFSMLTCLLAYVVGATS